MIEFMVGNTNTLMHAGVRNKITGAYDNAATVTLTKIEDQDGATLTGETFPKAMPYVAASSGDYRVNVAATLAIQAGKPYWAVIDVTGSSGEKDQRRVRIEAKYRQET